MSERKCRSCGCTTMNCRGCIAKTGGPCWWVEADRCSACVSRFDAIASLLTSLGDQALNVSRAHSVVMLFVDRDGTCHLGSSHTDRGAEVTLALRGMIANAMGGRDMPGVAQAARVPMPTDRAQCLYCQTEMTVDEGRAHMRTCEKSPLAQDLAAAKKRIAQLEVDLADARSDRAEVAPVWAPAPKAEG